MNSSLRIALLHNHYKQRGGEDTVFEAEHKLLTDHGHDVVVYDEDNHRIDQISSMRAAGETIWSRRSQKKLEYLITAFKPDIAHFHNTFLFISPAVYYTFQKHDIPVVQTLHNYRLGCPGALFLRDGKICEDCLIQKSFLPAIRHRCYRDSFSQTAVVTSMIGFHRNIGTYNNKIDAFIALGKFSRDKFVEIGLPAEKIFVKPNFQFPVSQARSGDGAQFLYAGRLSVEKGLDILIEAWQMTEGIPLQIFGTGPHESKTLKNTEKQVNIIVMGEKSKSDVLSGMLNSRAVVIPSKLYENFPMVILEAFSVGVPVIASNLGAMAEIVQGGVTGLHFEPGNPEDLARKVRWAWEHPAEMRQMGENAQKVFEEKYTPGKNYEQLKGIYRKVLEKK